jgi:hypothetical protein
LGCAIIDKGTINNNSDKNRHNKYALSIGVVGSIPDINFGNVKFHQIKLKDLGSTERRFDAFILTKEVFQEASLPKHKKLFNSLKKPVFFVGLYKPYWIFLKDGPTYNESPTFEYMGYTQGFLKMDDGSLMHWTISLANNEITKDNVYDMYIKLFRLIDNIKHGDYTLQDV